MENMHIALMHIFLRASCSGSAAHFRNVATSFANWDVLAGVPSSYSIIWKTRWNFKISLDIYSRGHDTFTTYYKDHLSKTKLKVKENGQKIIWIGKKLN